MVNSVCRINYHANVMAADGVLTCEHFHSVVVHEGFSGLYGLHGFTIWQLFRIQKSANGHQVKCDLRPVLNMYPAPLSSVSWQIIFPFRVRLFSCFSASLTSEKTDNPRRSALWNIELVVWFLSSLRKEVAIRRRICTHETEYDPNSGYVFCFSRWASFRERLTEESCIH